MLTNQVSNTFSTLKVALISFRNLPTTFLKHFNTYLALLSAGVVKHRVYRQKIICIQFTTNDIQFSALKLQIQILYMSYDLQSYIKANRRLGTLLPNLEILLQKLKRFPHVNRAHLPAISTAKQT